MFTQQMAACIAIANKSAPITSQLISSENGEIVAARREITFFSVRYFSEKCEWARTSQTLVRARPSQKNRRQSLAARVLQVHLQLKKPGLHRLQHQQYHLHPAVRQQQRLRRPRALRLPVPLRQMHHRLPDSGLALLHHPPDKWRTLLPAEAVLQPRVRRLPARPGRSKQPVCRRCILPRGITCICMRRAASILIRTCRHTVSFTENGV